VLQAYKDLKVLQDSQETLGLQALQVLQALLVQMELMVPLVLLVQPDPQGLLVPRGLLVLVAGM
jgi:hypothetical protein